MASRNIQCIFISPGAMDEISGGFIYNKFFIEKLQSKLNKPIIFVNATTHSDSFSLSERIASLCLEAADNMVVIDTLVLSQHINIFDHQAFKNAILFGLCHLPNCIWNDNASKQNDFKLLNMHDFLITTSLFAKNQLEKLGIPKSRLITIYPKMDLQAKPKKLPDFPHNILCVGNFMKSKNQHLIVDALEKISHLPWSLRLVGAENIVDEAYWNHINQLVDNVGLRGRVDLIRSKHRNEIIHHLEWAELFVLPTEFETFGMALAEARAFQIPIVTSDIEGVKESSFSKSTLYVNPDAESLRLALKKCISQEPYYSNLKKNYAYDEGYEKTRHEQWKLFGGIVNTIQLTARP